MTLTILDTSDLFLDLEPEVTETAAEGSRKGGVP